MPKWGIFNASLLLNEHGHPPFLFENWSYHMTNIQWTKFEQKSIQLLFQRNYLKNCFGLFLVNYRITRTSLPPTSQLLNDSQEP